MGIIKILYVEDSEGDVVLFSEALQESGIDHILDIASNGYEALQFLNNSDGFLNTELPDLILLDINMPVMDGFELLDIIKMDDRLKHLPVIMFTTSAAKNDVLIAYKKYANSYLVKPTMEDEFSILINGIKEYWINLAALPVS